MVTRRGRDVLEALDRLAEAEGAFVGTEFLAPVRRGHGVGVKFAGVRCRLKVSPPGFEGWGVLRADSLERATWVRGASMGERRKYLALFPGVRLILCRHEGGTWSGVAANAGDARVIVDGFAAVEFVDDAQVFDTVVTRFDGGQFWFESVDDRADPGAAAYLRQALGERVRPENLARRGLTAEQRTAYGAVYAARLRQAVLDEQSRGESRLRRALEHAGARLRDYAEHADVYRVSYVVDGARHTSVVRNADLSVLTAGICLSGRDRDFDLGSLVGVLREGRDEGRIVRTM